MRPIFKFALVAATMLAAPAMAQEAKPVKPCVAQVVKVGSPEYKRLVREMRWQGLRIDVKRADGSVKRVSDGGDFAPVALRHANVPTDCN